MSKTLKIVFAVFFTILALASMGMSWMRDGSKQPESCKSCHLVAPYHETWESSPFGAADHAGRGIGCQSCHARPLRQVVHEYVTYYITKDYREPLRERRIPKEECYKCHEHGSFEQIIAFTADLPEHRNPHNSPHYGEMECYTCHKMHAPSEDYCEMCHTPADRGPGWTLPKP
ncbi:MAG: cytochrome c3 family protein [Chloroflexi bacterium]|nr:cytochrome c3 family protein [Chloroflexota bacterium]